MTNTIHNKPVFFVDSLILNEQSAFVHKRLCGGPTFSAGTACAYSCTYCYVEQIVLKQKAVQDIRKSSGLSFDKIVIRRQNPLQKLADALTRNASSSDAVNLDAESILTAERIKSWNLTGMKGRVPKFHGSQFANTVVFGSPLVDVAATNELAKETVELCEMFLRLTSFDLRLLSKSPLLESIVATELHKRLPDEQAGAKKRVLFGFSTGTFNDTVAEAIEVTAPSPTSRLKALHLLQDNGFRTYGMLCPILPQFDPNIYANEAMKAIRADKCEAIWAEPINLRTRGQSEDGNEKAGHRDSFKATVDALEKVKLYDDAKLLETVTDDPQKWEEYCRSTFEALKEAAKGKQLWWMQYPKEQKHIHDYWDTQTNHGVLLLGAVVSIYRCSPFLFRQNDVNTSAILSKLADLKKTPNDILSFILEHLPKKTQLTLKEGIATFSSNTIGYMAQGIAEKLRQDPTGDVSRFFHESLSNDICSALSTYNVDKLIPELLATLAERLNTIITGQPFYTEAKFPNVKLREKTKQLLYENPTGVQRDRLNRCVLEDFCAVEAKDYSCNDMEVCQALLSGLNTFIKKPMKMSEDECHSWYDKLVAKGLKPSQETEDLHIREEKLKDWNLVHLNRLLLQDVFLQEIKKLSPALNLNGTQTALAQLPCEIVPPSPSPSEISTRKQMFEECEQVVQRGWSTVIEVGQALMKIREENLFKEAGYDAFEDYCRERWAWTRSTANRHIWAAQVANILEPIGSKPVRESQVRFLNGLKPDQVEAVWTTARTNAGSDEKITAETIRQIAAPLKKAARNGNPPIPKKEAPVNPLTLLIDQTMEAAKKQDMSLVLNLLEQLQKMVEKTKFGTNHKDSADVAVP